jgi:hypothetical protein
MSPELCLIFGLSFVPIVFNALNCNAKKRMNIRMKASFLFRRGVNPLAEVLMRLLQDLVPTTKKIP